MRFRWDGTLHLFKVLPFELSSAPRVFTRVMKSPKAPLRHQAFRNVVYLDDICLISPFMQDQAKTLATAWLLEKLGFVSKWKKSSTQISQVVEFLRFTVDTLQLIVSLPLKKVARISQICLDLLEKRSCYLRILASLIGKLQNASTVIPSGPLHVRSMQMDNIKGLANSHQNYAAELELSDPVLAELQWWTEISNGKSFVNADPELDVIITSDASTKCWGAECQGLTAQGQWSLTKKEQHINVLELRAAELALRSFTPLWQGRRFCLRLDNMTAVTQISKMGSPCSRRCVVVTQEIWEFVLSHKSIITTQYLPGHLNLISDRQSQVFRDSSNWELSPEVFNSVKEQFPSMQVELFADRLNHQLLR